MEVQLPLLQLPYGPLPGSRRGKSCGNRPRTMEEVSTCHSSRSHKRSPQTNWGSIPYKVGSTSGRRTLVQFFCSSVPLGIAQNSLFSVVLRLSRRGLLSRAEARPGLRRLSLILRQFRSWLRAETDSSSLLTRLGASHRQLTVSLSSTRSEDFDDGDLQRNTRRALQSRAPKNLRY